MSRKQLRDVRKMDVHDAVINPAPIKKTKGLNGKVVIT
jgi:transposase